MFCGHVPVPVNCFMQFLYHVLRYLRELYIVQSLAPNYIQRSKTKTLLKNDSVRYRFGYGYFFKLLKFSTVSVLFHIHIRFVFIYFCRRILAQVEKKNINHKAFNS